MRSPAAAGTLHALHVTFAPQFTADEDTSAAPYAAGYHISSINSDIQAHPDFGSSAQQHAAAVFQTAGHIHAQPVSSESANAAALRQPAEAVITVPLGSIPEGTLPDIPTASSSKPARQHGRLRSSNTEAASDISSKTIKTGKSSGIAENVKLHLNHPKQVTQTPGRYRQVLTWVGRVGWCGKAVVYAMIGGLACQSAASGSKPDAHKSTHDQVSASPQGAFVLLGTTLGGIDIAILLVMLVALVCYITWRFWEGLVGQGYDKSYSAKKNFFKFRVSPIVSGAVYCSYMVFILELMHREVQHVQDEGQQKEGWPSTWRHSGLGRAGLVLLGFSFIIATCIQLQGVLTRAWHRDYRDDLPAWAMRMVFTAGHFGFAGRAAAFLALAVLFFKDASGGDDAPHNSSMVANALQQLQGSTGLRAILMIVGILLVIYGLFATLSSWARVFPTPSPTRNRTVPASVIQEQQEQQQEQQKPDVETGRDVELSAAAGDAHVHATPAPAGLDRE